MTTTSSAAAKQPSNSRVDKRPASESEKRPDSGTELKVAGRTVPVSNLSKVLYPKVGFTKGQVIDYYLRVSSVLIPHLKARALTLKRYPNGVEGEFFYEKRCPIHRPDWVRTARVWSKHNQSDISLCVANDLPTLIWAANLADLEIHTYLAKSSDMTKPTYVVFDLDPGPPADIQHCAQVALHLRDLLSELKLRALPKTSGSKGLQVYIPLNTPSSYETTKPFAKEIASILEQKYPKLVVSKMDKSLRKGKVLVDWSQNDYFKTTVCVYSLRAKDHPTVSTPVSWDEVANALKRKERDKLVFNSDQVLARIEQKGDLFSPVLKLKQRLPKLETLKAKLKVQE